MLFDPIYFKREFFNIFIFLYLEMTDVSKK